jgi:hypothetical protein
VFGACPENGSTFALPELLLEEFDRLAKIGRD